MLNIIPTRATNHPDYTESDGIQALRSELKKGIESIRQEHLFTIEEAWEEIDAI